MSDLKPCPFCGGEASGMPRFVMGYAGDGIRCKRCGAETPRHLTEGDAVRWWNRRAQPEGTWCDCGDSIEKHGERETRASHKDDELSRLRETAGLAERFVNAKGRYHSQHAMCDLMEHFGRPCVRPGAAE